MSLSTTTQLTPLDWATRYIEHGICPVPVPHKEKGPKIPGWQNMRLDATTVARYFNSEQQNIGILLGAPSGNIVDIDIDRPDLIDLFEQFLPPTPARFGRTSAPRSHRFYRVDESVKKRAYTAPNPEATEQKRRSTFLEIRGDGCQTVVPPSIHPSGERITWDWEGDGLPEPAEMPLEVLKTAVGRAASAGLLHDHYPQEGSRNYTMLALAGGLVRADWPLEEAEDFIRAVARAAGDDDVESRVRSVAATYKKHAAGESTVGWTALAEIIGKETVKTICEWLGVKSVGAGGDSTEAQRVLNLTEGVPLFRTSLGDRYAAIKIKGHTEVMPLTQRGDFADYLTKQHYEQHGKLVSERAVANAIAYCRAQATQTEPPVEVFTRLASRDEATYLDLADGTGQAVEIDAAGWRIVSDPPVYFRRPQGVLPLPTPVRGGSLAELENFANVKSDRDRVLITAWLIMALNPWGPYPILALSGEQGSAKTSLSRYLRTIIDPSLIPVRAASKDEDTIVLAAQNAHIVAFDNMSYAGESVADMLCRLATGGGLGKRRLYTDGDEKLFYRRAPIILNGIPDLATRGDLADRMVSVTLQAIPANKRRTEQEVDAAFIAAHPRILGALCDAASAALRNCPTVKLGGLPRMADFARWVTAAEPALGWVPGTFMTAYAENQSAVAAGVIDSSVLATVVQRFMDGAPDFVAPREQWHGSTTELLRALEEKNVATENEKQDKSWPKDATRLSKALRRPATSLRACGLDIESREHTGVRRGRELWITRTAPDASVPHKCSESDGDQGFTVPQGRYAPSGTLASGLASAPPLADGDQGFTVPQGRWHASSSFLVHTKKEEEKEEGERSVCVEVGKNSVPACHPTPTEAVFTAIADSPERTLGVPDSVPLVPASVPACRTNVLPTPYIWTSADFKKET